MYTRSSAEKEVLNPMGPSSHHHHHHHLAVALQFIQTSETDILWMVRLGDPKGPDLGCTCKNQNGLQRPHLQLSSKSPSDRRPNYEIVGMNKHGISRILTISQLLIHFTYHPWTKLLASNIDQKWLVTSLTASKTLHLASDLSKCPPRTSE